MGESKLLYICQLEEAGCQCYTMAAKDGYPYIIRSKDLTTPKLEAAGMLTLHLFQDLLSLEDKFF